MSHPFTNLNTKVRSSERRVFRRQPVHSLAYVELGEGNGGIVLNVSEGGIAVQAVMSLMNDEVPSMRLQLAHSNKQIETKGRVTWTSEFRKLAGVQFVDLSPQALSQIREWIALENPEQQKAKTTPAPGTEPVVSRTAEPTAASSASEQQILIESLLTFTGKMPTFSEASAAPLPEAVRDASIPPEGIAAPSVESSPKLTSSQEPILKLPVSAAPVTSVAPKVPAPSPRVDFALPEPRKGFPASSSPPPDRYGFKHGPLEEPLTPAVGTGPKNFKTVLVVGLFAIASLVIGWLAGRSGLRRVVTNDASSENLTEEPRPVVASPNVSEIEVIDAKNQRWMIPFNGPSIRVEKKIADQSATNVSGISGNNAAYQNPPLSTPIPLKNPSATAGEPFNAPQVSRDAEEKPPATPVTGVSPRPISIPTPPARTAADKGGDLQPGELTQRVEPVYPQEALAERVEGTVKLDAVIDAEGNVKSVQVLGGPKQLLDAAAQAVRKWHYSPTLLNGMPIQTERQITIKFQLAPNQSN